MCHYRKSGGQSVRLVTSEQKFSTSMRQLNLPSTSQIRANTAIIGDFAQNIRFMRRGPRREANARPAHRYDAPMSVEYFDERQEMVAAIRVIAQHLAAEVGKTTLI